QPRSRIGPRPHRKRDYRAEHQPRADGEGLWDVQRGADRQPQRSCARVPARARARAGWRAGVDRRRVTTALTWSTFAKLRRNLTTTEDTEQGLPATVSPSVFRGGGLIMQPG